MVPGAMHPEPFWILYRDILVRISRQKNRGSLARPFSISRLPVSLDSYMQIKGSAPLSLLPILCTVYISFHVFLFRLQRLVRWFLSVSDRFLSSLSDDGFPPPFPCTPPIHGGLPPLHGLCFLYIGFDTDNPYTFFHRFCILGIHHGLLCCILGSDYSGINNSQSIHHIHNRFFENTLSLSLDVYRA